MRSSQCDGPTNRRQGKTSRRVFEYGQVPRTPPCGETSTIDRHPALFLSGELGAAKCPQWRTSRRLVTDTLKPRPASTDAATTQADIRRICVPNRAERRSARRGNAKTPVLCVATCAERVVLQHQPRARAPSVVSEGGSNTILCVRCTLFRVGPYSIPFCCILARSRYAYPQHNGRHRNAVKLPAAQGCRSPRNSSTLW